MLIEDGRLTKPVQIIKIKMSAKRKDVSKVGTAKKKKVTALDAKQIKVLEEQVLASLSSANAVVDILSGVDSDNADIKTKEAGINGSKICETYLTSVALFRIFLHYKAFETAEVSDKSGNCVSLRRLTILAAAKVVAWLHAQYMDFIAYLLKQLSAEAEIQVKVLLLIFTDRLSHRTCSCSS